jgi:heterodisulfide reductase subunit C
VEVPKLSPPRVVDHVDFDFREELNAFAEGFRHNYCYQCGACVADCPAARYTTTFNPRLIMLKALLGFKDELIAPDSDIWNCTNCYTCSERCPQDCRPIDVIIAMKNMCAAEDKAPDLVIATSDAVLQTGTTTKASPLVDKRRLQFGLKPLATVPFEELQNLLEIG